jgi:hypothetical protein
MWGKRICKQPKQRNLNCDADDEHERVFAKLANERPEQQLFASRFAKASTRARELPLGESNPNFRHSLGATIRWLFICKRGSSCHLIAVVIRWQFYFLIRTRQREKQREK